MARGFRSLVAIVVVFGLVVGVGMGIWQRNGQPSGTVITHAPGGVMVGGAMNGNGAPVVVPGGALNGNGVPIVVPGGTPSDVEGDATPFRGTIESISDTTLVLAPPTKLNKVTLADGGKVYTTMAITAEDIKVGDTVVASGLAGEDGVIRADSIDVGTAEASSATPRAPMVGIIGEGASPTGAATGGAVRAATGGATQEGTPDDGRGRQVARARVMGTVEAVSAEELSIQTTSGLTKVAIGPEAVIRSVVEGAWSDLMPGASVLVIGKPGPDEVIAASVIRVLDEPAMPTGAETEPTPTQ